MSKTTQYDWQLMMMQMGPTDLPQLTIDHTFLASLLRRQENAINMHGKLLDSDGNEVHISSKDGEVGTTGRFDSLRLGKLLSVAGLDSLDSKFAKVRSCVHNSAV